jgi:hypothetical protein
LLFISFSSTFAFQLSSFDKGVNVTKTTSSAGVNLSINLGEVKAVDQIDAEVFGKIIASELQNYSAELQCEVSITAEISIGVIKANVTVKVSGPCSEIRKDGKNIANQILQDIKDRLSHQ